MESTDAVKYGLVEAEVIGTLNVLNIKSTMEVVGIIVGDHHDWFVLQVDP